MVLPALLPWPLVALSTSSPRNWVLPEGGLTWWLVIWCVKMLVHVGHWLHLLSERWLADKVSVPRVMFLSWDSQMLHVQDLRPQGTAALDNETGPGRHPLGELVSQPRTAPGHPHIAHHKRPVSLLVLHFFYSNQYWDHSKETHPTSNSFNFFSNHHYLALNWCVFLSPSLESKDPEGRPVIVLVTVICIVSRRVSRT